jgi:hypothetical protein
MKLGTEYEISFFSNSLDSFFFYSFNDFGGDKTPLDKSVRAPTTLVVKENTLTVLGY